MLWLDVAKKSLNVFRKDHDFYLNLEREFDHAHPKSMIDNEKTWQVDGAPLMIDDLRVLLCMAHYLSEKAAPSPSKFPHEIKTSDERLRVLREWCDKHDDVSKDSDIGVFVSDVRKNVLNFFDDNFSSKSVTQRISDELFVELDAYFNKFTTENDRNNFLGKYGTVADWKFRMFTEQQAIISATMARIPYLANTTMTYDLEAALHPLLGKMYDQENLSHRALFKFINAIGFKNAILSYPPYVYEHVRLSIASLDNDGLIAKAIDIFELVVNNLGDTQDLGSLAKKFHHLADTIFIGCATHADVIRSIFARDPSTTEFYAKKYRVMCMAFIAIMKLVRKNTFHRKNETPTPSEIIKPVEPSSSSPEGQTSTSSPAFVVDEIVVNGETYVRVVHN